MNPRTLNKKSTQDQSMLLESNADVSVSISGDASISNSSLDLLEQHQAREQARLLQRFRELREWQQQQQQQLMQQQQQQLRTWQDEQSKVQTLIASQGGKTLKPSVEISRSPLMTPPTKPRPNKVPNTATDSVSYSQIAGISLDSGLVVSMQDTLKSQSSLPKPVMYPSLTSTQGIGDDNDEDKYTTSELFSNLGSHDELQERAKEMDEDAKPVLDWMSDSSENVLQGSQLPPPRASRGGHQLAGLEQLLKTAPAGLLQQMLGLLPGGKAMEAQGRGGHTTEDVELSASPTLPQQKQPTARRLLNYHASYEDEERREITVGNHKQQVKQNLQQQQQEQIFLKHEQAHQQHHQWQPQQRSERQIPKQHQRNGLMAFAEQYVDPQFVPRSFTLEDNDLDPSSVINGHAGHSQKRKEEQDEEEDDDSYEEDEEQASISREEEDERTTQASKQTRHEDRPISGTGGRKTFEQLLEEELQQEKQLQQENGEHGAQKKIPFLKKGEGIARFNSAPKKPPAKKKQASKPQNLPYHSDWSGLVRGEPSRAQNIQGGGKKSSVGSRLKNMGKPADNGNGVQEEKKGFVRKVQKSPEERPVAKLSLIRSVASKKMEEQQKHLHHEQQQQHYQQDYLQQQEEKEQESLQQPFFRAGPRRLGDLSTIIEQSPSLDGRSNLADDHDLTELDSLAEFEVLEEAADNMSLCSSSSLVGRLIYGDRQGQKEAVQKLRTITESLKSARSDGSGSGLDVKESSSGLTAAMVNSNYNNNSNNNCIISQYSEDQSTSVLNNVIQSTTENQDHESSEGTLTESSDDEGAERRLTASYGANTKETRSDRASGDINQSDSDIPVNQVHIPSPSKVLTRKVAPLSSKFTVASDTLSLLKSLSAHASLLMSNPSHSSPSSISSVTSAVTTSSVSALNRLQSLENAVTISEGFNFLSSNSTLPPNLFSTASKDGMLLSSGLRPIMAQTFQPSSSQFTSAPLPSSDDNSITQQQKVIGNESQSRISNEQQYKSEKYRAESSDEETQDSGDELDSQGEESGKLEKHLERKDAYNDKEKKEILTKDEETPKDYVAVSAFDDESSWEDEDDYDAFNKATTSTTKSPSSSSVPGPQANGESSTPPTSRLVSKLFPKLRQKPSAETEKQSLQQASSQPLNTATGIQSSILREKLKELDMEIERFRSENSNLEKLRREREEGLAKLKQEIENFQREKASELRRLEEFKAEEMKKLKRERKLFESYQKKLRSMPDKKEREEIENLKTQLQEVQEELKHKESRWTASTARLKNRVAELELENGEVKEEVRILERKRLEWMTSQAGSGRNGSHTSSNGKVGGPSSIGGGSASQTHCQPGPRSSTPTRESELQASAPQPKDAAIKGTSLHTKASIPTVTSASSNIGSNYSSSNTNNTRGKSSKHPTGHNSNNMNNSNNAKPSHGGSNVTGGKTAVFNGLPQTSASSEQPQIHKGLPATTASLAAPSIPVTVLAPSVQQHQPLQTSKDGGDGLQTMQNSAVPVMMECTIPAGTDVTKMPGLQADHQSPAKSAAREALEKAVVDKGDPSMFTENLHQDGKLEKSYRTGAKEILFPNGTVKEISADGQTIVCRLANGDIRQILPDHRVVYIFSEAQIMQTTFPDGLETFQFQNGQIERRYPDGTVEITFPSKDIKYLFPDGGQEVILTDGTVMQYNRQGERTVEYPSGDREVHTAEFQRREFPDGIVKTIYPDGRHETWFPNGRVRMRDKDGNVVMDQIVYR